jgi:hypothetical protein
MDVSETSSICASREGARFRDLLCKEFLWEP